MVNETDEEQIRKVVQLYFTGTHKGSEDEVKLAFDSDAFIVGFFKGSIVKWSLQEFIDRVTQEPTAAEKGEELDKEILILDVTNNAAMVKARVVAAGITFTDYISLLKKEGKWVIDHKIFTT